MLGTQTEWNIVRCSGGADFDFVASYSVRARSLRTHISLNRRETECTSCSVSADILEDDDEEEEESDNEGDLPA